MKSVRLLSPKTFAWAIVLINIVSLSLHAFISHHSGSTLSGLSFVAFAITLLLGLVQSRTDKKRFLPALCALLVSILHSILAYGL